MPVDRGTWHDGVRHWCLAHAPDLARAGATLGVRGGYALLVAGAFYPLWQQTGGDPVALRLALLGILGNVSGNLLSNVIQGTHDSLLGGLGRGRRGESPQDGPEQAVHRLLEEREDNEVRAAIDDLVDQSQAVDVAAETLCAMPPPDDRREWLERKALDQVFAAWKSKFVPLSGVETLPVDVALVRTEGEGALQRRVLDSIPDLRQAFERHERFALLGDPGGGKTTLLRRLALEGLHACVQDEGARIPLYVDLSGHRESKPVDFLLQQWRDQDYERGLGESLDDVLRRGGLLLLADALNEMPRERMHDQVTAWHTWLQTACPAGNRAVFTCRTLDYSHPLALPQVEALPLSPERVHEFLDRHLPPTDVKALWDALQDDHRACIEADQERRSLLTLVGNPFVLWATVQVFEREGKLERNRGRLFGRLGLRLLERESCRRMGKKERTNDTWRDAHRFEAPLARLGFAAQERGEGTQIVCGLLPGLLPSLPTPADTLAHALGSRVLRNHAYLEGDRVSFAHQLLQESFAAQELVRRLAHDEPPGDLWRALRHVDDMPEPEGWGEWDPLPPPPGTGWEETTILAAGLAEGDVLVKLLDRVRATYPALVARCLDEAGMEENVPDSLRDVLRKQLLADLGDPHVHLRARLEAGIRLGRIRDPRFLPVPGKGYVPPALCEVKAGRYLVGNPGRADPRYDPEAYADEAHGAEVDLAAFRIGRYPVTNAEYRLFVQDHGYEEDTWWEGPDAKRWRAGEAVGEFADWLAYQRWAKAQPDDWRTRLAGQRRPEDLETIATLRRMSEAELLATLREQSEDLRRDRPSLWGDPAYSGWVGDNQPVMGVCWYEARAYCRWLDARWRADGPAEISAGYEVRLPTEAEWEAAARGPEGRRYPWGPEFDSGRANTLEGRVLRVNPVGAYPEGRAACGALEMSGNVWEWTLSLWGTTTNAPDYGYPYRSGDGREDVLAGPDALRIVRGGSWNRDARLARCATRTRDLPFGRNYYVGFRVVVALPSLRAVDVLDGPFLSGEYERAPRFLVS
jgi:formylglycine-generating enzyme required for sulfatase activity